MTGASSVDGRRLRRAAQATASFTGRAVGVLVTLMVVRVVGVGEDANSLFLALGVYALLSSVVLSLVEMHTVAVAGTDRTLPQKAFMASGVLVGVAAGTVTLVIVVVVAVFASAMREALDLVLIVLLTAPLTGAYAAYLGLGVVGDRWVLPAIGSWARAVLTVVLVVVLLDAWGFVGVPVALVCGDLVRLLPAARDTFVGMTALRAPARRTVVDCLWQMPSAFAGAANPFVSRVLSAQLRFGSLAILDLAEKAFGFVVLAFTQGLLPFWFRHWMSAEDRAVRVARVVRAATTAMLGGVLGAVLATTAVVLAAPFVVGDALKGDERVFMLATTAYMAGLPAQLTAQVLVRLVVLEGRARLLNLSAAAQLVTNAVACVVLGRTWGVPGVALATTITAWVGLVSVVFFCRAALLARREAAA